MDSDAVHQNLAFEGAALAEIQPILCIKLVSQTFRGGERKTFTIKTFAEDAKMNADSGILGGSGQYLIETSTFWWALTC